MSLFDLLRRGAPAAAQTRPQEPSMPRAAVGAGASTTFTGMDDPRLLEFIRRGEVEGFSPASRSLRNMAILRCVTLIAESIGMLPLNLIQNDSDKEYATAHPAYRLLKRKPNDWQTPYEFKNLLQLHALLHGNGYARVIWSGNRPIRLIPMNPLATMPKLSFDWQMTYEYTSPGGATTTLAAKEVLHLRDLSLDGVHGISRIRLAHEALDLARHAETAASRTFQTGVMAGGAIEVPKELSDNAYKRMQDSLGDNYSGSENTGKFMILEEGAKASKWANTATDAQQLETRNHQIEEVARAYGVPRPLLMMDDTSWGSGIEQLAIFFVQYGLSHWFSAWEQACARVLLSEAELDTMQFKVNERALLRGTLNDQANFFAKALGAGGQKPWMSQNEVRECSDLPKSDDPTADDLKNPMTQKGPINEPPAAS
jgi:HK97 family phage portal protein